jgi:hypothetical protein
MPYTLGVHSWFSESIVCKYKSARRERIIITVVTGRAVRVVKRASSFKTHTTQSKSHKKLMNSIQQIFAKLAARIRIHIQSLTKPSAKNEVPAKGRGIN